MQPNAHSKQPKMYDDMRKPVAAQGRVLMNMDRGRSRKTQAARAKAPASKSHGRAFFEVHTFPCRKTASRRKPMTVKATNPPDVNSCRDRLVHPYPRRNLWGDCFPHRPPSKPETQQITTQFASFTGFSRTHYFFCCQDRLVHRPSSVFARSLQYFHVGFTFLTEPTSLEMFSSPYLESFNLRFIRDSANCLFGCSLASLQEGGLA